MQESNFIKIIAMNIFLSVTTMSAQNLLQYVQPHSGTGYATTYAAKKHSESGGTETNANTIPAVTLPFAMTQWTPQTRTTEVKCLPPYFYKDSLFSGFRGSHWLSGSCTQDYGSFTIMPVRGRLKVSAKEYSIPFSHKNEVTTPAYYNLAANNIVTEMTSTLRCGLMQFTLANDDSLYILVTPNSDKQRGFVQVDAQKGEIWGYNPTHRIYQGWGNPAGFSGWFYIKIDQPFSVKGSFSDGQLYGQDSISNKKDLGVYAGFKLNRGEKILLKIGTSFSSLAGAKNNLASEVGNKSFTEIRSASQQKWEEALSKINVKTSIEKDKRIFYTALYHAMQHPRTYNDVDGTYPVFSQANQLANAGNRNYYDDFSMWDIYRAQLPLLQILDTNKTNDFVHSMILKGQQGNWLPIFPCWNSFTSAMIGDHVTAFIASSYAKGIRGYDAHEAYRLIRKNAYNVANESDYINGMGRRALPSYLKHNYIPLEDSVPIAFHKKEQVSRTLEYAFDDYALSIVAKALDKKEDYKTLSARAKNYKNVFDRTVNMVRGRYADGSWYQPFNADKREPYITEGTPRQYTFYVPHDVPGLSKMMGGSNNLEKALDTLFTKDEYWHGNEPGHQIPFMYNHTDAPWKTQQQVHKILSEEYSDGPGGLSGNDDAGQMSAWYIFAAMGFYPVDPVSGNYLLSSPIFDEVKVKLPSGSMLKIICHKITPSDKYIIYTKWNGKKYSKNYLPHSMISKGGTLEIWLSDEPSSWGAKFKDQPRGL